MKYKVITLNKKNIKDFAKERNTLLKKSDKEWVFFLDSDEKMSKKLNTEINSAIASNKYRAYYIDRKNYFMGEYSGTDKIIRLAKRSAGKWKRAVHETWEINGDVGYLNNPIIHNTGGVRQMVSKINFYSTIHARENLKEGKKTSLFKIMFYPPLKFIESVVSGRGLVFSMLQSFHSFLSWSKQWNYPKG